MPTRCLGDYLFKLKSLKSMLVKPEMTWNPPYITAEPEIMQRKLRQGDKFLVIASDGLWDKFSSEEVVDLVSEFFRKQDAGILDENQASNVCTFLIRQALINAMGGKEEDHLRTVFQLDPKLRRYVHDDITITVVRFNTDNLTEENAMSTVWNDEHNFPHPPQIPVTSPARDIFTKCSGSVRANDKSGTSRTGVVNGSAGIIGAATICDDGSCSPIIHGMSSNERGRFGTTDGTASNSPIRA